MQSLFGNIVIIINVIPVAISKPKLKTSVRLVVVVHKRIAPLFLRS